MPAPPTLGLAVVAEKISAVPAGDPECAAAVAPDPPCALARHRRFQNGGGAGLEIDPTIGSGLAIAAGQHDVAEVDRLLSGRRDVHDPRWRAVLDKRQ